MKKVTALFVVALLALGILGSVQAATVTNQGQVITVTLHSETADAGTVKVDQSTYATPNQRSGVIVAHCAITESTTSLDIGATVPKGAIVLPYPVIEVATAILPATATNALAVGGVTLLSAGTTLGSTGIKQGSLAAPAITTSADKLTLTITGSAATSGVFTVYAPYILGNAGR